MPTLGMEDGVSSGMAAESGLVSGRARPPKRARGWISTSDRAKAASDETTQLSALMSYQLLLKTAAASLREPSWAVSEGIRLGLGSTEPTGATPAIREGLHRKP